MKTSFSTSSAAIPPASVITTALVAVCSNLLADSFLKRGDRWILSGDSITSTDTYRQILQLAADHYHPSAAIVIGNRGV